MLNDPSAIALGPTNGIADPQVRDFLDKLKVAWGAVTRGDNRFIGAAEFASLAQQAASSMLADGVIAGQGGPIQAGQITNSLQQMADAIRSTVVYQLLDKQVSVQDIQEVRAMVDDAIDQARAGISTEQTTRFSQDSVLASAINRIWGYIGGSTAVITDGALAAATPSAATATKWNSVISAVTDPNTGLIASAAILQETRTYANNVDATLNATYTVKAQISAGGQTVAGGFALAATTGAGSDQGPTIDFGVLANKFFIAAPSSGYNPATEYGTNLGSPFIVVTTPTTINGVTYGAGVYMKKAIIGDASIDSAKIANLAVGTAHIQSAAITNAKIGNAEVDELKIQGNSVTIPVSASTNTSINVAPPYGSGYAADSTFSLLTLPMFTSKGGTVTVTFGMTFLKFEPDAPLVGSLIIYRNGTAIRTFANIQFGLTMTFPPVTDVPGNGTNVTYSVALFLPASANNTVTTATILHRGGVALEAIR